MSSMPDSTAIGVNAADLTTADLTTADVMTANLTAPGSSAPGTLTTEWVASDSDFELGRRALLEITSADSIGAPAGSIDQGDGVTTLYFETLLSGYPGWRWTVSIAHVADTPGSVLETELTPGDFALLSPDWVPWVDRLAEYTAAQDTAVENDDESDDDDETDDDESDDDYDEDDEDDLGSDVLHGGDLDGVDIDDLDDPDDDDSDDDDSDDDDSESEHERSV
jgi:hypothetical protein